MTDSLSLSTTDIFAWENEHFSGGTARRPVALVRGSGAYLWDSEDHKYLDLSSAQGWANIGHCHPEVTRAIQEQAACFVAQTESSFSLQRALWFKEFFEILQITFGESNQGYLSRIHLCNSGTEALETCIKMARYFTKRTEVVACKRAFHGRTMGALSATWNPQYRNAFEPLIPGFSHFAFNDIQAVQVAVQEKTAALIVETVQGEGGVFPATSEFLMECQSVCRRAGALLVVDEVQTGFGRTARWFGSDHHASKGFAPDMVAFGKSLGGGIPMGAVAWRGALGTLEQGLHGSTFGGNPLACAASRATFRVIQKEGLLAHADGLSRMLFQKLNSFSSSVIREIRGQGLMAGIELKQKVTPLLKDLMQRGIWALPAGPNVLRLLPPLILSEQELNAGLQTVEEALLDFGRK